MKPILRTLLCFALLPAVGHGASPDAEASPPNVILLLADDLGYSDLGCQGSAIYQTPHIDQLAREGLRFTDAYAPHSTCAPSRVGIITGTYPARHQGVNNRVGGGLPLAEVTLAERLKAQGYTTCHIGKWHIHRGRKELRPLQQGFDLCYGTNEAGQPSNYLYPFVRGKAPFDVTDITGHKGDHLTTRLTDKAIEFITEHKDQPFFLNFSYYAVHTPIAAQPDKVKKYKALARENPSQKLVPTYAALVEHLDDSVGRLTDTLESLGLLERTVIIFFSDNGGLAECTSNAPLRSEKGSIYEGGLRVPFLVRLPGGTAAGTIIHEPVIGIDLCPTILSLTGTPLPDNLDGIDLAPLLAGAPASPSPRSLFFLQHPEPTHYRSYPTTRTPGGTIRQGPWKLIEHYETADGRHEHRFELYNLDIDLGESNNLAEQEPERVEAMRKAMAQWRESVNPPPYNASLYTAGKARKR